MNDFMQCPTHDLPVKRESTKGKSQIIALMDITDMHNEEDFNILSKDVFEQNKAAGWWQDMDRDIFMLLQLVSTEIAEATEGERKNLMDDKLPIRKMGEVELADAAIRLLDIAGRHGWRYTQKCPPDSDAYAVLLGALSGGDELNIAKAHFALNMQLAAIGRSIVFEDEWHEEAYSAMMDMLFVVAHRMGYNMVAAIAEKREFNKTRSDHTLEERAATNGKKF